MKVTGFMTIQPLPAGERQTCQIVPCPKAPKGCSELATYELRFFDGISWMCASHTMEVRAALDQSQQVEIKRPRGTN